MHLTPFETFVIWLLWFYQLCCLVNSNKRLNKLTVGDILYILLFATNTFILLNTHYMWV